MNRSYWSVMCSAALAGVLVLSAPVWGQQKTAKQCDEEWTANKAAIQASGKKKKDFIAECRAGSGTSTAPASPQSPSAAKPAPSAATNPSGTTAAPASPQSPSAAKPAPSAAANPSGTTAAPAAAGQFASEAQARSHCPGDTVVWANLDSKVYHFSGNRSYGNTKKGAYMCERDTTAAGFRAAKNEKHP